MPFTHIHSQHAPRTSPQRNDTLNRHTSRGWNGDSKSPRFRQGLFILHFGNLRHITVFVLFNDNRINFCSAFLCNSRFKATALIVSVFICQSFSQGSWLDANPPQLVREDNLADRRSSLSGNFCPQWELVRCLQPSFLISPLLSAAVTHCRAHPSIWDWTWSQQQSQWQFDTIEVVGLNDQNRAAKAGFRACRFR